MIGFLNTLTELSMGGHWLMFEELSIIPSLTSTSSLTSSINSPSQTCSPFSLNFIIMFTAFLLTDSSESPYIETRIFSPCSKKLLFFKNIVANIFNFFYPVSSLFSLSFCTSFLIPQLTFY